MRELAAGYAPEEVRFIVADYRRTLGDTVPAPYIGAYAGGARTAGAYAEQLAEVLAVRVPRRACQPVSSRTARGGQDRSSTSWSTTTTWPRVRPRRCSRCWTSEMIQVLLSDEADRPRK
jgi:hypothetical protein